MRILSIIIILFLCGCSKYDKEQAMNSCVFEEIKTKNNQDIWAQNDYVHACMNNKGFDFTFKDNCIGTMQSNCFNYTWRVFF